MVSMKHCFSVYFCFIQCLIALKFIKIVLFIIVAVFFVPIFEREECVSSEFKVVLKQ